MQSPIGRFAHISNRPRRQPNRMTTFLADENKVWCGCFVGTFTEWRDKIRNTYSDDYPGKIKYRKQYEAALVYFAELAAIDGMPQYKELLEG